MLKRDMEKLGAKQGKLVLKFESVGGQMNGADI